MGKIKNVYYPDSQVYDYVIQELKKRNITIEELAKEALSHQVQFNPSLTVEPFINAIKKQFKKREVLNVLMTGFALDDLANKELLPQPLQEVVYQDYGHYNVDEVLGLYGVSASFGTVSACQFGHLDLNKKGIAKKLDQDGKDHITVNTFADDLISGIIANAEAKVMHDYAGDSVEMDL